MIVVMYTKGNTLVTIKKQKYCVNTYYLYYEHHEIAQTTIVFEKKQIEGYCHSYSLFHRFGK